MNTPNWMREPLVHFLVAGAAIFALFAWRGEPVDPSSRTIIVDQVVQAQIVQRFEQTLGRVPTDAELDQQIEQFVRDEVLYREALRLGLDQDDIVVRRRLATKMDLAASAAAEAAVPSEEVLRDWYSENISRYASAERVDFDQIYFGKLAGAEEALRLLRDSADWEALGDPISLPSSLVRSADQDIRDRFGTEFTENLKQMEQGSDWQGPIPSGFGWHLVRVTRRQTSEASDFDDVRSQVENDWRSSNIAERKETAYELLRAAYRVEVRK
ncbi:MAG: peptidylprolyl isomerase [Erythrobacter sp.]